MPSRNGLGRSIFSRSFRGLRLQRFGCSRHGLLALELKQSSLDSFFRKDPSGGGAATNTNPHPTAHAPQVSCSAIDGGSASSSSVSDASISDAATEYERARLENIRRNRDFLLNLGISAGVEAPKPDLRRQARRSLRAPPSTSLSLRRSARKRPFGSSSLELKEEEKIEPVEPPALTYVDSSVFQYTCENACRDLPSILSSSFSCYSLASGFRITGKSLQSLLIAAGGHGGMISVFGVDMIEDDDDARREGASEREIEGPLLSWKASKSWVSGVLFLEDNPMLLVSSSNDGGVVVWDVGKQPSLESPSWSPPVVGESTKLHSGGIFSMHHLGDSIVTASKDSSVGISRLGADGKLIVERTISGHHSGVIRGVCFGYLDSLILRWTTRQISASKFI
ncbi:unnamed protein product [Spirodela intermedia]|uniref:Uncharacterized protein n=1 Tax=Spirodela intermedia TaxID=51605 RepID=A0A7I8IZL9_SPIIN|nr:unnamed protein product [Spirodela intermedia]CAA6663328.1 unnamed protein product [Spirodela intermedia]